jgi:hypothetical protein
MAKYLFVTISNQQFPVWQKASPQSLPMGGKPPRPMVETIG